MIKELLKNKTAKQRANIKGLEIAKLKSLPRIKRKDFDIEIVETKAIEGGVEVFARAYKNGKQIGFGKDGTVDIERFRIFNPPILVDDPNGEIVRKGSVDSLTGETNPDRTLREDPQEALLQVIEHNLTVMKNIHGAERIVKGKRGNTTSTFFASAGDGHLRRFGGSWNDVRTAGSGDGENTGTSSRYGEGCAQRGNASDFVKRFFFPFDTSGLPEDDDISSAKFSTYQYGKMTADMYITESTQASITSLADSDFSKLTLNSPTLLSSEIDTSSFTPDSYNDISLNSNGISAISKTGNTKFVLRTKEDVEDTDGQTETGYGCYLSEETGTTKDPKLVVEHSAAATATGNFLPFFL